MTNHHVGGRDLALIVVYITMPLIATLVFALRVWVRIKLKPSYEDWAAGVGCLLFVIYGGCAAAGPFYGMGQHTYQIPFDNRAAALKVVRICSLFYVVSNMAVKMSICLMLLSLVMEKYHKRLIYITTAMLQMYSVFYFFQLLFECIPTSFLWTRSAGAIDGRCVDGNVLMVSTYIYAALTLVFDWTMALLPWFVVRKLQMDLRTRLMIAFVLGIGSIASVATIARIPYITQLSETSNFFHANADLAVWSCFETGLSITAASAAKLKPLFKRSPSHTNEHRAPRLVRIPSLFHIPTSFASSKTLTVEVSQNCAEYGREDEKSC